VRLTLEVRSTTQQIHTANDGHHLQLVIKLQMEGTGGPKLPPVAPAPESIRRDGRLLWIKPFAVLFDAANESPVGISEDDLE
jgi:hypothetical protein